MHEKAASKLYILKDDKMRFDWVNILATVIFVSIVVTLILAVASYFAYKVREARAPRTASELRQGGEGKVFFEEYRPSDTAKTANTKQG